MQNEPRHDEQLFEQELRNLVSQCSEGMDVSSIMFRVLKDRVIQEWKSEQYIAWLERQAELRKQSADRSDDDLPWSDDKEGFSR
jgi:hypothetical protein